MKIKFIRHTPPHVEVGVCYGFSDLDVDGEYDEHLNSIQRRLNGFAPNAVFSSPLMRCSKLASSLFSEHNLLIDDRLKEMNFGSWEMQRWEDIPGHLLSEWTDQLWTYQTPQGESFGEFYRRVMAFFSSIEQGDSNEQIAVVTHSGVIRCVLMHCLKIPVSHIFNLDLPYSCVIEVGRSSEGYYRVKIE